MLCSKHKIFYGLLPLFLLFFSFFFSSFSVIDTYAVENSFTWSSSQTAGSYYLCGGSSPYSCSDFSYLYITNNDTSVTTGLSVDTYFDYNLGLSSGGNLSSNRFYPFAYNSYFVDLTSNVISVFVNTRQSSSDFLNAGGSITFKVTSDNPYSSGGITPSGSIEITENGTYDVTNYAEAVVNVPESSGGGSGGNYHEDLVNIYHAIMICGAICLVLYFFYCIYRVIIKSTGGK